MQDWTKLMVENTIGARRRHKLNLRIFHFTTYNKNLKTAGTLTDIRKLKVKNIQHH